MQRKWLISCLVLILTGTVHGQNQHKDLQQLSKMEMAGIETKTAKVKWMHTKSNNAFAKYNPFTLAFSGLMYTYQRILSPQLSSSCIYTPSCSNFSKQLIHDYGLFKGLFLSADRIMRCNRVSANDISPLNIEEHLHLAKDDVMNFKKRKW